MKPLLPILAGSLLVLSACTTLQAQQAADSEQILGEAAFHKTTMAELKTLPERQLIVRGEGENIWYEFVDRQFCRCSYIGYDKQLAAVQEIRRARVRDHEYAVRAIGITSAGADERGWGAWDPMGLDVIRPRAD
jgi:hypothetical protein